MVVFLQKVAKTSRQIGAFSQEISALTVSAVTGCTTVCGVVLTVRSLRCLLLEDIQGKWRFHQDL